MRKLIDNPPEHVVLAMRWVEGMIAKAREIPNAEARAFVLEIMTEAAEACARRRIDAAKEGEGRQ